jgi:hypothetical protein
VKETAGTNSEKAPGKELLDARLVYETRLVLSRDPTPGELKLLQTFYERAFSMLKAPALANASAATNNRFNVSTRELDALTAVGSVLFNLDSALSR